MKLALVIRGIADEECEGLMRTSQVLHQQSLKVGRATSPRSKETRGQRTQEQNINMSVANGLTGVS